MTTWLTQVVMEKTPRVCLSINY